MKIYYLSRQGNYIVYNQNVFQIRSYNVEGVYFEMLQ